MKSILHPSGSRGHANHGWLETWHSFSFARYYNPDRIQFGALRVLNDDRIAAGRGFGEHPHDNMEIITIPLKGELEHKDTLGNSGIIRSGEVQVMSAGSGIQHSEFNPDREKETELLQIWVIPNMGQVQPRYDQRSLKEFEVENAFYQILSPDREDQGVWIHQDAWFDLGKFSRDTTLSYHFRRPGNGLYAFMIEGSASFEGQELQRRDGLGIWDTAELEIKAAGGSFILLMELPGNFG